MNVRRAAPTLFAALCLGLCAFVLRGQIAARPLPRAAAFEPHAPPDSETYGNDKPADPAGPRPPGIPKGLHEAKGPARRAVLATINGQLAAIRTGDADRAWFYQSRDLHRGFSSARAFVDTITGHYPEFGHAASASFGPVLMDAAGDHAGVAVKVRGRNGKLAPAYYLLIKEDGVYKVEGVKGGQALN